MAPIIVRPPATTFRRYREVGIVLGVLGALAAGLYLAPQPATLGLVLLGLGLPAVLLIWRRPEFGLVAIIFLVSSLVPANVIDLRLPIGGLNLQDLVLIGVLGLLILRGLFHKNLSIPWLPVSAPLLVFLGLALFSTLYALYYQKVESHWVFNDLRTMFFYGAYFVTAWSVTNRRQVATVLAGLFIFADLIAVVVILQQFLGTNHPLLAAMSSSWRLDPLEQEGSGTFGMVRIMPPGVVLIYFAMITAFCLMAFTRHSRRLRTVLALQFVYLNFGLLLTYTRALWIAAAIALGLVLIALFPIYKAHLVRYLLIGILVLGLVVGLLGALLQQDATSGLLATSSARFLSLLAPQETLDSLSLQWRVFETEQGLRSMSEHPLVGVGLGNSYRDVTTFMGESLGWMSGSLEAGELSRFTRFLHNSYLSIAVKMGLPALACFLWFCVALVVNSALLYRHQSEGQSRAIALAVLASVVGLMEWSFFHQHFVQTESTAIIGLMAGLAASLCQGAGGQNGLEQPPRQASARQRS
jgi:O-antigen ligase